MKTGADTIECANCGRVIGKLETPRIYRDQPVCPVCWKVLGDDAVEASPLDGLAAAVQREALNYETRSDVARRMGGNVTPTARIYTAPPRLIEQTNKTWKAHMLFGAIVSVVGLLVTLIGVGVEGTGVAVVGVVMLLGGFAWYMGARLGAWWNHG